MASSKKRGRCHICCESGPLTDEHFPPRSAGNNKWTQYHTLYGMVLGSRFNKAPPMTEARSGIKRRSLCERCNGRTAAFYNDAFADWTLQALELAQKIGHESYVNVVFYEIKPLSVLKQVVVMALAAADFGISDPLTRLRRFALYPFESHLPAGIGVRAYLNPPRRAELATDKVLAPNRVADGRGGVGRGGRHSLR